MSSRFAGVVKLVDTLDSKSNPVYFCGFNSAAIKCVSCGKSLQKTLESRATGCADLLQAIDGGEVS